MIVGIVGNGYVGKATRILAVEEETDLSQIDTWASQESTPLGRDFGKLIHWALVYDTDESKCEPKGLGMEELKRCSIVFVCVPTPARKDGSCDTSIVELVVSQLKKLDIQNIIVRSTVPIGTCKNLGVAFMPEFLTEKNWQEDLKNTSEWILGIDEDSEVISNLHAFLNFARYNSRIRGSEIIQTRTSEAEACKLVRNAFLATKVSFCNEIYDWCTQNKMDPEVVLELMSMDKRIGYSHTSVPGPDGKYGFGGTCFPKDAKSLLSQIEKVTSSYILKSAIHRNETVDRPEKDWENDKGRAVSF